MMDRWLDIVGGIFVLLVLAYAVFRQLELRFESSRRRRVTIAKLADRKTAIVNGLLTDIEKEVIGDPDDSGPVYINCYLVYGFTPGGESTEKIRGKHHVAREKIFEPGFALHVGRPVRVRYAVDDPADSELVDF